MLAAAMANVYEFSAAIRSLSSFCPEMAEILKLARPTFVQGPAGLGSTTINNPDELWI